MSSNRHKKDRKEFYISKKVNGKRVKLEAKAPELPSYFVLPELWTPSTLLSNKLHKIPVVINRHRIYQINDNIRDLVKMHGPFGIDVPYNLESFIRMLAKIGHGLAVAELGPENFEPCLLDIILKGDMSIAGSVIGHYADFFPHNWDYINFRHHVSLKIISTPDGDYSGQWLCAGIQLLSRYNPINYTVVVGRLTPTISILKWTGLGRLTPSQLEDFRRHYSIPPARH